MGQFGKIGSISINELNSILLSLTCKNEELYLAASPAKDDTPVSTAADLYRHQARVWDAMRKQLESIVWCVSDLQNTELEVKEAMAKVRRMERITKEAKKVSTFPAFGRHTALELVMEAAHESKVARIVPAASPKVLELQRPDEEPLLKAVAGGPDLDTMNRNAMKRNGGAEHE